MGLRYCQHLYWKVVTADQWPNNVLVVFFFTRHYSEDGACVLLWSLHPERSLSKERSVLWRVPLAVGVIAIEWKIQTSLLSSLFCCLLWEWSAQLGRSFGPAGATCPVCFGVVNERAGIPQITQYGWMVSSYLYSSLLSLSHILCTWSKMLG